MFKVQLHPDSDQLPAQPVSTYKGRSQLSGAVVNLLSYALLKGIFEHLGIMGLNKW